MKRSRTVRSRALTTATATALFAGAALAVPASSAGAAVAGPCSGWAVSTLASGLGSLENLAPDGRGGFFLSATDAGAVQHLDGAGTVTTVVRGVDAPGGLVLTGSTLYYATGNSPLNTLLGLPGTVSALDLVTGTTRVIARATAPNGLSALPDGTLAATSASLLGLSGVTRVVPTTGIAQARWSRAGHTNGAYLAADGSTLYTDDPYTGQVLAIPLSRTPAGASVAGPARTVATIGSALDIVDDLVADSRGVLYVAVNSGSRVARVDPATGASCTIAAVTNPSSVRIASGSHGPALFTSGFDGTIRELRPPDGVQL